MHSWGVVLRDTPIARNLPFDDECLLWVEHVEKLAKGGLIVSEISRDDAGRNDDGIEVEAARDFEGHTKKRNGIDPRVKWDEVRNCDERMPRFLECVLHPHFDCVNILNGLVSNH